jgi:hypothetical protein
MVPLEEFMVVVVPELHRAQVHLVVAQVPQA